MTVPKIIGHIESVNDQQIVVRVSKTAEIANAQELGARVGQVGSYVVIPQENGDLLAMVTAQRTRQLNRRADDRPEDQSTVMTVLAVGFIREGRFCRGISHYPRL